MILFIRLEFPGANCTEPDSIEIGIEEWSQVEKRPQIGI